MSGSNAGTPSSAEAGRAFDIALDASQGTLRIRMRGFWTVQVASHFMLENRAKIATCRARFGRLKQLVDLVGMPVQSQEVTAIVHDISLYKPGDRVAVVLDSTLAKMAARRTLNEYPDGVAREAFVSASAAETWLHAYS
jgi:hypothetical protein